MAAEALITTARRRRRRPRQAGDSNPRRRSVPKAGDARRQPCVSAAAVARRRPVGSAIAAGLFFVCLIANANALLQLDQVPNRITNKKSATFTYVCTPLDVADGDSCDVKVRACPYFLGNACSLEYTHASRAERRHPETDGGSREI